ncbi:MAG: GTPase domain-containing protein [Dehalococcoidia bacterium]
MVNQLIKGTAAGEATDFLNTASTRDAGLDSPWWITRLFHSLWSKRALCIIGSYASGKSRLFQYITTSEDFDVAEPNPPTIHTATARHRRIGSQDFKTVNDFGGDEELDAKWIEFIGKYLPVAIILVVDLAGLVDKKSGKFDPRARRRVKLRNKIVTANTRMKQHISKFNSLSMAVEDARPAYERREEQRRLTGILVLINKWDQWTSDDNALDGQNVAAFIQEVRDQVPKIDQLEQDHSFDVIWRPISLRTDLRSTTQMALTDFADQLSARES